MKPNHNLSNQFAQLLSQAIRRVATENNCTLSAIQREVGSAIGRNGNYTIDYWRRGHIPKEANDVERLARELTQRKGFQNPAELNQFLEYAHFPKTAILSAELSAFFPQHSLQPKWIAPPDTCMFRSTPFLAGRPILHPGQFFGRHQALQRTFHLLKHMPLQHIAIIGPRSSGKTSLLHYIKSIGTASPAQLRPGQKQDWLPQPETYRWVYIDFQNARMQNPEILLQTILKGLGFNAPTPCKLVDFMRAVEKGLTAPAIILMDEIEQALAAEGLKQKQLWTSLRSLACDEIGERLGFILASKEAPHQLAEHAPDGLGIFLGVFGHTIELGAFTETEARELIASSPCPFPPDDVAWILEQSQSWPVLLQVMCMARWNAEETADEGWKADALKQSIPYRFLLDSPMQKLA